MNNSQCVLTNQRRAGLNWTNRKFVFIIYLIFIIFTPIIVNNIGSCSKIGIEPIVYARLKDDIIIIVESVENGSKVVDGKIIIDFEKKKRR